MTTVTTVGRAIVSPRVKRMKSNKKIRRVRIVRWRTRDGTRTISRFTLLAEKSLRSPPREIGSRLIKLFAIGRPPYDLHIRTRARHPDLRRSGKMQPLAAGESQSESERGSIRAEYRDSCGTSSIPRNRIGPPYGFPSPVCRLSTTRSSENGIVAR